MGFWWKWKSRSGRGGHGRLGFTPFSLFSLFSSCILLPFTMAPVIFISRSSRRPRLWRIPLQVFGLFNVYLYGSTLSWTGWGRSHPSGFQRLLTSYRYTPLTLVPSSLTGGECWRTLFFGLLRHCSGSPKNKQDTQE